MEVVIAAAVTSGVVSVVGYLRWRAWLKFLDKASERGADMSEAAAAAAKYPVPLEASAASVAEVVLRRERPP